MIKEFLSILACPHCHSPLKSSTKHLLCTNKNCNAQFPIKQGIPILLPSKLENLKDASFKKAQVDFFNKWSDKNRGSTKLKKNYCGNFFSTVVGKKKIDYSEKTMSKLIEKMPKNAYVLELGCGAGEHTAFLAKLRNDIHLVALDLSLKSVIETKKRLKSEKIKNQVSFVVSDVEKLPFKDKAFNGILAVMLFHHLVHLEESIKEIRRTLSSRGQVLIVDLVANNPFITLGRKIFPHLPYKIKLYFKKDYLLENGEIPQVFPHKINKIKRTVKKTGLNINKEERYDLFLLALGPLVTILPFLQHLFPELFLNFLYNVEKRLIRSNFFRNFSGAIVLWISH